ncbi:6-phosphogluconolactonase [Thiomonas delicata]|uniref:6-phosphogluconolactonase n=1 Tax=Thiomonas delicata TaxID=364030 RepID=A0A238D3L3_THIDL|nr:6-phosphogluconolactonase [Thiomonas delicata]SBP87770.1 conserved hypothetical protein [Thiomonas delicata]
MRTPQTGDAGVRWHRVQNAAALPGEACRRIRNAASDAIRQRGRFLIVLAGGDTPREVYAMLRSVDTDWSRWQVYFGDERCLPDDDAGRNSRMAAQAWLDHVPIPHDQVLVPPAEQGAAIAASAYARTLRDVGEFDLVLLGLGEDGHTAGLFPGRDLGVAAEAPDVLPVLDAPKPPSQRVSMSARRLSRTRAVLFLVAGASKRHAVRQWRLGNDIPARSIRPESGVDVVIQASLLCV